LSKEKSWDIIFFGRLQQKKGIFELIDAVKMLSSRGTDIRLLFVGRGTEEFELKSLIAEHSLENKIKIAGYVSEFSKLIHLLSSSKIFVLPSYTEGIPRSMVEAMYLGIPVIVTPVGGIKYIIIDGENGFLVAPRDTDALAAKISEVLEKYEGGKLRSLIDTAKDTALELSFENRADAFLNASR
jgi:glycosyltransferase involved in cell wall biosynthesis